MQNTAKNHPTEIDLIDGEDVDVDNREKNVEGKDENNINLSTADSYSHAIAIARMHWREKDKSDCLESSVLFHLYHSLCVINDIGMTKRKICYDLDLLGTGSRHSHKLGVNIEISTATTNLWKSIHKKALIRKQAGIDIELGKSPGYNHSFNAMTRFLGQLELTLTTRLIFQSVTSCPLDVLPFNSDSKTICDHIQLPLSLNQL